MKAEVSLKVTIDYDGNLEHLKTEIKRQAGKMNLCGGSVTHGCYNFTVDKVEVE